MAQVRDALGRPLPGADAQMLMAPRPRSVRPRDGDGHPPRQSAVLILLYPGQDGLEFILTKRTDTLSHHKGQISLPGGSKDESDPSLAATALREAEEELGISLEGSELLGSLSDLLTGSSNYRIRPVVAYLPAEPACTPNPAEVAQVIRVPLRTLIDPNVRREETWSLRETPVAVPFFDIEGHKVWGATAMILSEFAEVLAAIEP